MSNIQSARRCLTFYPVWNKVAPFQTVDPPGFPADTHHFVRWASRGAVRRNHGSTRVKIQALKGFKDILPAESGVWQRIEQTARDVFHRFGFAEIRVPILEKTDLFVRSIGEATDIVEKEMYTFIDRNGVSLSLRPEGTAPVLRAFIEHSLHTLQPVQRLYTIGPMFRHERPQKGRLRQFHQLSVEVLGADHPRLDAEVMAMAWMLLTELGLTVRLEINSLGCPACRPDFKAALENFLADRAGSLCEDCERRRLTNPLRVLDCKSSHCRAQYQTAPAITDYLCPGCADHFAAVEQGLDLLGIPATRNKFMVRGLDYYTRTTFELVTDQLGAQSAVGAGGRYDGLVAQLDGPKLPGIGFGMGMERLALLLTEQVGASAPAGADLYIAALGPAALERGFQMAHVLRGQGVRVSMEHDGKSLKSQMKQAGRLAARYALILGDEELASGQAVLRNMGAGTQDSLALGDNLHDWAAGLVARIAES